MNVHDHTKSDPAATELSGRSLLVDPIVNKGTAFTQSERSDLGLHGLLPDEVNSLDQQIMRTRLEFGRLHDDLERHVYLRALQDQNETLFYRFVQLNLTATMPIVYTPTVGLATQNFSRIYRRPRGLFLSYQNRNRMTEILDAVKAEAAVVVVTDGERILGLGDQGAGGMAIPIGKLSLYSAFGGIDPASTLPIMLDVGTNNQKLLDDELYIGARHERITGDDYDSFVDQFVSALKTRFPSVLLQWEDFAQHQASRLLDRYKSEILSFNDDIQGTAAVSTAAIWSALRSTGRSLADQKICIAGAGSAGTGIGAMLLEALVDAGVENPLTHLFLVDRKGLIHDGRTDLKAHQVPLAHPVENVSSWIDKTESGLGPIVANSGATVLVGVTGQPNMFTEQIVTSMMQATDRPVVLPQSNPTSRSEAHPADILTWTNGKAVVATGSPFDDVISEGQTFKISQSNNVYVFPGLGLGVLAVGATQISSAMLMRAASAVTGEQDVRSVSDGILPPLEEVAQVTTRIASEVARSARDDGFAPDYDDDEIDRRIAAYRWTPTYRTLTAN